MRLACTVCLLQMADLTEAQRTVLQQAVEIVNSSLSGAAQGSLSRMNSGSGTSGVTDRDLLGGDLLGGRSDTAPTGSGRRTLSLHRGRSDTATTGSGKRSLSHHRGRSDTATTGSGKRSLSHHRELLLDGSSDTATTSSGRRTLHDRLLGSRSDTATTSSGRRTVSHVNIKSGGIAKLLSTTTRRCHGKYPLTHSTPSKADGDLGMLFFCFLFFSSATVQ